MQGCTLVLMAESRKLLGSNKKLLFFKINFMKSVMNSFVNHSGIKSCFLVI